MKKFKDEELSRILSHAHELTQYGAERTQDDCQRVGCVNQVAYNVANNIAAAGKNQKVSEAFDHDPPPRGPIGTLRFLEKIGAA